jgi:hypothetical protein
LGKAANQLNGYDIYWYSNDHDPPHFNIEKRGHWGIQVYFLLSCESFLDYVIVWQNQKKGPSGKELQLFCDYITEHKEHLLLEWETKVCKRK